MLDVAPKHLKEVKRILSQHVPEFHIVAFGSRINGKAKPNSDLDLAIMTKEPLSTERVALLRDAFSESDLPYKVDIVDYADISDNFKKIIDADKKPI